MYCVYESNGNISSCIRGCWFLKAATDAKKSAGPSESFMASYNNQPAKKGLHFCFNREILYATVKSYAKSIVVIAAYTSNVVLV